jgi:carbamoyl-phosphate synthase large subunit
VRVAVTAAGGSAGVTLISELLRLGFEVLALDMHPRAAGFALAQVADVVPAASSPDYIASLTAVLLRHEVDCLIPLAHEEIPCVARAAEVLALRGVRTWLAPASRVDLVDDKWRFARFLQRVGIPGPRSWLGAPGLDLPQSVQLIAKPRWGCGAHGIRLLSNLDRDLTDLGNVPGDHVVQELIVGREFSADCLTRRDLSVAACVLRYRDRVRGGVCVESQTFADATVSALVCELLVAAQLEGFANVQGFVTDSGPVIIEANPRFSGGFGASLAAGPDLVGQYVQGVMDRPISPTALNYRTGVVAVTLPLFHEIPSDRPNAFEV